MIVSRKALVLGAYLSSIGFGGAGWGLANDGANQVQGINLPVGPTKLNAPSFFNGGTNGFIRFNAPYGESRVDASTTGGSLLGFQSGYWVLEPATPQTWTLPALTNAAAPSIPFNSNVSIRWKFLNTGSSTAIVKPSANSSGQLINNNSGLTNNRVSLSNGQWAEFVGVLNAAGNVTYWAVITTGTIS